MTRRGLLIVLLLTLAPQPACFLKFWGKGEKKEKEAKVKIYDIYGTVKEIDREKLVIDSRRGPMQFAMAPSSIKGSDFEEGAYVHVYYKQEGGVSEVTMVVEKIN